MSSKMQMHPGLLILDEWLNLLLQTNRIYCPVFGYNLCSLDASAISSIHSQNSLKSLRFASLIASLYVVSAFLYLGQFPAGQGFRESCVLARLVLHQGISFDKVAGQLTPYAP